MDVGGCEVEGLADAEGPRALADLRSVAADRQALLVDASTDDGDRAG
jgi:hypothetical protein